MTKDQRDVAKASFLICTLALLRIFLEPQLRLIQKLSVAAVVALVIGLLCVTVMRRWPVFSNRGRTIGAIVMLVSIFVLVFLLMVPTM